MRDSACRLKKLKHFEVILNIFEFSLVWEYVEFGGLVTRNISKIFFKASCALLQSHAEFNRLL